MSYSRTRATTGKKGLKIRKGKTLTDKITDREDMETYKDSLQDRNELLENIGKIDNKLKENKNDLMFLPTDSSELPGTNYNSMSQVDDERNILTDLNNRLNFMKKRQLADARQKHKTMRSLEKKYNVPEKERLAKTSIMGEKKAYKPNGTFVRFYGGKTMKKKYKKGKREKREKTKKGKTKKVKKIRNMKKKSKTRKNKL